MSSRPIFLFTLLCFIAVSTVTGQDTTRTGSAEKYLISAKAGGVNYSKGTVTVVRSDERTGPILKGDQIQVGDRLSTGENGRVELLLNPGSFLRLGSSSSLEFVTTSLDDLRIKVLQGSAIFEVIATDQFKVEVVTPTGTATLVESGIYRIDVDAAGGRVAVYDGKALVNGGLKVKGGRSAPLNTLVASAAKFDRKAKDELADWSKTRAKDLAVLTSTLRNNSFRNSLLNSMMTGRFSIFDSFGLWIYSPLGRAYCFLPFGSGWYSPYGYGYGSGMSGLNLPRPTVIPPGGPRVDPPTREVPSEGKLGRRPPIEDSRAQRPPYTAVEKRQQHGGNRGGWGNADGERGSPFANGGRRTDFPSDTRSFPAGSSMPQSAPSSAPMSLPPSTPGKMSPIDN